MNFPVETRDVSPFIPRRILQLGRRRLSAGEERERGGRGVCVEESTCVSVWEGREGGREGGRERRGEVWCGVVWSGVEKEWSGASR